MQVPKMSIRWWKREHEDVDNDILENVDALDALRNCGLLKFFMCLGIHTQHELLQLMIGYWDPDMGCFSD